MKEDFLPLDSRSGTIWYDNQLVPWNQAKFHILTHGLHYGTSVFEGLRAYNGQIFKLAEHSARLKRSAEIIHLNLHYSREEIDQACLQVLNKNNLRDAYIRPVAWSGSHELGIAARRNPTHFAIACWEWPSYFSHEKALEGIRLSISRWRRPSPETSPVQSKCATHYVLSVLSKHEAEDRQFDDALMLDYRGLVAEATGANIFFIKDGQIHTPKPECALDGITRQTVLDIARQQSIPVIERHIHPSEIATFSEAFLTGTAAEVTLVNCIEDTRFDPGQISTMMRYIYMDQVSGKGRPEKT